MRKYIAIILVLLIPLTLGVAGVYGEPDNEAETEPVSTVTSTLPVPESTLEKTPVTTEAPIAEPTTETTEPAVEPEPEPEPEPTGTITITRKGADQYGGFWYTIEQKQANGSYKLLLQVAILPGESEVCITGLPLNNDYLVREQRRTTVDGVPGRAYVELHLTEDRPDKVVNYVGAPTYSKWLTDISSNVTRKEG